VCVEDLRPFLFREHRSFEGLEIKEFAAIVSGDGLEDLFQIFGLGFRIGIGSAYQRGCFFHLIKLAAVWFGIQKYPDGFGVLLVVLHDP